MGETNKYPDLRQMSGEALVNELIAQTLADVIIKKHTTDPLQRELLARLARLAALEKAAKDIPELLRCFMCSYADTECDAEIVAAARKYISEHGGTLGALAQARGGLINALSPPTERGTW